jgi:hypothetical protein
MHNAHVALTYAQDHAAPIGGCPTVTCSKHAFGASGLRTCALRCFDRLESEQNLFEGLVQVRFPSLPSTCERGIAHIPKEFCDPVFSRLSSVSIVLSDRGRASKTVLCSIRHFLARTSSQNYVNFGLHVI